MSRTSPRSSTISLRPTERASFLWTPITGESRIAAANDRETGKSLKCATILIVSGDIRCRLRLPSPSHSAYPRLCGYTGLRGPALRLENRCSRGDDGWLKVRSNGSTRPRGTVSSNPRRAVKTCSFIFRRCRRLVFPPSTKDRRSNTKRSPIAARPRLRISRFSAATRTPVFG